MDTLVLDVPAMYGDHHVIEVRRILLELPSIEEVYASSYLRTVEIVFDPNQINPEDIRAKLDEVGYLQEPAFPHESGVAAYGQDSNNTFFRHTAAYTQTGISVSFAQTVNLIQRPLFPCPGIKPAVEIVDESD